MECNRSVRAYQNACPTPAVIRCLILPRLSSELDMPPKIFSWQFLYLLGLDYTKPTHRIPVHRSTRSQWQPDQKPNNVLPYLPTSPRQRESNFSPMTKKVRTTIRLAVWH